MGGRPELAHREENPRKRMRENGEQISPSPGELAQATLPKSFWSTEKARGRGDLSEKPRGWRGRLNSKASHTQAC